MKTRTGILAALYAASVPAARASAVLHMQQSPQPSPLPNKVSSSPTPLGTGTSSDPSVPVCGAGFTYCGYILRDHKNFHETDIIQAYCEADRSNCINGTTRTNPFQALYICVPPDANPVQAWAGSSSSMDNKIGVTRPTVHNQGLEKSSHNKNSQRSHQDHHPDADNIEKRFHHHIHPNMALANQHGVHFPLQSSTSTSTSTSSPSSTTIKTEQSQQPESSGSSPDDIDNDSNSNSTSCAFSATRPGNKIELLCACSRQCLNPTSDHIGRCDLPCSS